MRISLRNRLALVFFAITFLAIGFLYMYVTPGLQHRLVDERVSELSSDARRYSGPIAATAGTAAPLSTIKQLVDAAAQATNARVTVMSVATAVAPYGPQLSMVADSSNVGATNTLGQKTALAAIGTMRDATGIVPTSGGSLAEAAQPVILDGRTVQVILYTAPVSDVVRSVSLIRHDILVAGAISLLLALIGGYLVARWLAARVKRLEVAAKQIAAGEFGEPIQDNSSDELGQLAAAFNDMQRQLAQLELARKRFIATASHELRTPVFSLGGFVELLEDDELEPETRRRFLEQVKDQVARLRKLSVDLLDLSRLEAGSLELRPEQVDLGELARSVSAEFVPTLAQHDAHLELRLPARAEANCDPVRIAQIMRILIDNALTHTPPGTRIVVTAGREDGHIRVAVRDDGEGIDHEALPRIFEPFFTADDAQGSGLGLAIASELAERMNGELRVSTEPGQTVFTLQVPA
ncbi:MAG TPA: HAMP domain-containing sensor histidine kinase [Solirubrobacteraceae bacterium]|jgi:signal transduction histidine kinase|nr:HAMP domain-containing sensor histidine kinase [Solirubrobacteraceae bacterium]